MLSYRLVCLVWSRAQATWRISELVSPGMALSQGRLVVTKTNFGWESVLLEPAFDSAVGRTYAEWSLDQTDRSCDVFLGVTVLEAAPRGDDVRNSPLSRVYDCYDSSVYPQGRAPASWDGRGRRLWQGDRVGLLVEGGRAWVYVNGERVGGGAMAEGLPRRLRFLAAASRQDTRVRLVEGARPPA